MHPSTTFVTRPIYLIGRRRWQYCHTIAARVDTHTTVTTTQQNRAVSTIYPTPAHSHVIQFLFTDIARYIYKQSSFTQAITWLETGRCLAQVLDKTVPQLCQDCLLHSINPLTAKYFLTLQLIRTRKMYKMFVKRWYSMYNFLQSYRPYQKHL